MISNPHGANMPVKLKCFEISEIPNISTEKNKRAAHEY